MDRQEEQNLKAAVVVGEQADPSRARHGLGAHHAVLAAGVPHLNGDGLRHGCPCCQKGGKETKRGFSNNILACFSCAAYDDLSLCLI